MIPEVSTPARDVAANLVLARQSARARGQKVATEAYDDAVSIWDRVIMLEADGATITEAEELASQADDLVDDLVTDAGKAFGPTTMDADETKAVLDALHWGVVGAARVRGAEVAILVRAREAKA